MLLWILRLIAAPGDEPAPFIAARIAAAALLSFLAALLLGPSAIRWLTSRKLGERVDSASERLNELHAAKQNTPTMGGVFIVAAIVLSTLICADHSSGWTWCGLFVALAFSAIGTRDDWVKLTTRRRGLSARRKMILICAVSLIAAAGLSVMQRGTAYHNHFMCPLGLTSWAIGLVPFLLWAVFLLSGFSNAVNLTDGLDGLAAGCMVFAGTAVSALAYLSGHRLLAEHLSIPHFIGAGELAVLGAATVGASLGFLWFNAAPAQVFMGDAGSLPLGGLLAFIALAIRQEWLLLVIGGVFVAEALSVILQVGSYKLTGKRIFACSPLHHHFQFRGMPETRIVIRFWIIAALLAIAGLATLPMR